MANSGPLSRIEWVEGELRAAILSGELQPGQRLLTAQLSERFSVSPTPLREALHRFAGEGLVEFVPQKGARVTSLSADDCRELTEMRTLLDPVAVTRSIESATDEWRAAVHAASDELLRAWNERDRGPGPVDAAYRDFYTDLTAPCPSERLRRFAASFRDQEARYRTVTYPRLDPDRFERGHRQLVDAALDADAGAATEAITRQITEFAACYLDGSET